jgi:hypothetical protein
VLLEWPRFGGQVNLSYSVNQREGLGVIKYQPNVNERQRRVGFAVIPGIDNEHEHDNEHDEKDGGGIPALRLNLFFGPL